MPGCGSSDLFPGFGLLNDGRWIVVHVVQTLVGLDGGHGGLGSISS